ncbi:DUF2867 domain-containing protein [Thalassococcus sp. S3]|uniref:DUF2867 domain-containing protein n=1 Tax=Thalassococcus sp. S3 TaxID=2017482 RepID=UPI001023F96C|nr:DUF2867 domain-containing protein [Thalassococcus sp. S3]QBF32492.1 hypothetical protein CFI11_14890 [Thalassococcus sp. S3]
MTLSKISRAPLPADSLLHQRFETGDFLDCFATEAALGARDAAEIVTDFPGWAQSLVQLRNLLVAPFGLRGDSPDVPDKIGLFPVETETSNEVIAGFDDKHLNFQVSVYADGSRVSVATWVRPHNLGGRAYLATIMPFHIFIVRDALARVGRVDASRARPA